MLLIIASCEDGNGIEELIFYVLLIGSEASRVEGHALCLPPWDTGVIVRVYVCINVCTNG